MTMLTSIRRAIMLYVVTKYSTICGAGFICPLEAEFCEFDTNRAGLDIRSSSTGLTITECYDLCVTVPTCVAVMYREGNGQCWMKYRLGIPTPYLGLHLVKIGCSASLQPHGTQGIVNASTPYLKLVCDTGHMLRGRLNGTVSCDRSVEIGQDIASCQKIATLGKYQMSRKKGSSADPLVHSSIESMTVLPLPDCVGKCVKDRRCQWLTYNHSTQGCKLFQVSLVEEKLLVDGSSSEVFWFQLR